MTVRAMACWQINNTERLWAEVATDSDYRPDIAHDMVSRTSELLAESLDRVYFKHTGGTLSKTEPEEEKT